MRPEAHVAAATEILDEIEGGQPAERCLTTWARTHRFAGSGDRAAIRDLVFDALRRKRSYGWLGGGPSGRALMLGRLRDAGQAVAPVFSGTGHAPAPMSPEEAALDARLKDAPDAVRLDCPDWLWPKFRTDLGDRAALVLAALRDRAPVFLRVNARRATSEQARAALAEDGILTEPHPLAVTALRVVENERRIRQARAFRDGLVELQDAASQAVVARCLERLDGDAVLDFCAGGGGKALAFEAAGVGRVVAHDSDPKRMSDLPGRAARAGAKIAIEAAPQGVFDLVLCDAPCSGSGAWRRQPEAKWALSETRLQELTAMQDAVLDAAHRFVRPGGVLAYATCSVLEDENGRRVERFLSTVPGWRCVEQVRWTPLDGGDGFFLAVMKET